MKKRTKIELEIRNALSAMLMNSIGNKKSAAVLRYIIRYCKKSQKKGDYILFAIPDLHNRELHQLLCIFEIHNRDFLRLKRKYLNSLPSICNKTKECLKFLADLFSSKEVAKGRIEDKVRVGAMLFNSGFYFECHECLEEVWLEEKGTEKSFLKSLIHASVAFYHLEYENIHGAINYLERIRTRFKHFDNLFLGVNVKAFLSDIDNSIKQLKESRSHYPKGAIPKIKIVDQ